MGSQDRYGMVAFRSRQHALHFAQILKNKGYPIQIMSTPSQIAVGCGLSLRFPVHVTQQVIEIYKKHRRPIIGFYTVKKLGNRDKFEKIPFIS